MSRLLLLIDAQHAFLTAPYLAPAAAQLRAGCARWLRHFRGRGEPVWHVHTMLAPGQPTMAHWSGPRCLKGSPEAAVPAELQPADHERVLLKSVFSPFVEHDLAAQLRAAGITHLVLAGLHTHACLRLTAQDAYQRGFAVALAEGACGSDEPLLAAATERYLHSRGIGLERLRVSRWQRSPVTGEQLFRLCETGIERVGRLRRHSAARTGWLTRLREAFPERELEDLLVSDLGKPRRSARGELLFARSLLKGCRDLKIPAGKQPLGICALVTPFNNPVSIPLGKLVPALLFGNSIAWKPASPADRISLRMLRWLRSSGVGPAQLQLLRGGAELARQLAAHAEVDALSLSGGVAAGWSLGELGWRRWKPLQAELGGNNAALVCRFTPELADELVDAAFGFAGQRCTATRRVVVPVARLEVWTQLLIDAVRRLSFGHPDDPATQVGPVVSRQARRQAEDLLRDARRRGARIVQPLGPSRACFMSPALVLGAQPDWDVCRFESFAPVLVVLSAASFTEALRIVDDVPQGLVASLYSRRPERWRKFCRQVRCGVLKWNQPTASVAPELAFGGWKQSGYGPPEHGPGDVEFWTRWQSRYGEVQEGGPT